MGCLCDNIDNKSFNAYKELKSIIEKINKQTIIKEEKVFLIKSNSIKNFIALIENEQNDKILEKKFNKYELETNIKIISDYQEFIKLKEEEKEIIVVNENFLNNMNMKKFRNKNVLLNKYNNDLKIKFAASFEEAGIKKKNNYLFELFELPTTQISKNK